MPYRFLEDIATGDAAFEADVKAITYHMFEVKKTEENWTARVILDI